MELLSRQSWIILLGVLLFPVCQPLLITQHSNVITTTNHAIATPLLQVYYMGHPCSILGAGAHATCALIRVTHSNPGSDALSLSNRFHLDSNGLLFTTVPFDVTDAGTTFSFDIRCTQSSENALIAVQETTARVEITGEQTQFRPVNDGEEAPVAERCFPEHLSFDVYENVAGRVIGNVYPYSKENRQLRYSLQTNTSAVSVDPHSGDIFLERPLDHDGKSDQAGTPVLLSLSLACTRLRENNAAEKSDAGGSQLRKNNPTDESDAGGSLPNTGDTYGEPPVVETVTVAINIHDVNDNGPKIKRLGRPDTTKQVNPVQQLDLDNLEKGAVLSSVVWTDRDSGDDTNHYTATILDDDTGHFELGPILSMPLPTEGRSYYTTLLIGEPFDIIQNTIHVQISVEDTTLCNSGDASKVLFELSFEVNWNNDRPTGKPTLPPPPLQPAITRTKESSSEGSILTQTIYRRTLSVDHDQNTSIIGLHQMTKPCVDKNSEHLQCLVHNVSSQCDRFMDASLFRLDESNRLFILHALEQIDIGCNIELNIDCAPNGEISSYLTSAIVSLSITSNPDPICDMPPNLQLNVYENAVNMVIGSVNAIGIWSEDDAVYEIEYSDPSIYNDNFPISVHRGLLYLELRLDYEKQSELNFKLLCNHGDPIMTSQTDVTVIVLDVDDNRPFIQDLNNPNGTIVQDKGVIELAEQDVKWRVQLAFADLDSPEVNEYATVIHSEHSDIFEVSSPEHFYGSIYIATLKFKDGKGFPDDVSVINITVSIIDLSYCPRFNDESIARVQFKMLLKPLDTTSTANPTPSLWAQTAHVIEVTVSGSAAKYTRITALKDEPGLEHAIDFQIKESHITELNVTYHEGILYVADPKVLQSRGQGSHFVDITARHGHDLRRMNIKLHISITSESSAALNSIQCVQPAGSCSFEYTETDCLKLCGEGASNGCKWRQNENEGLMSSAYATCSPDLATCPDGRCDELEEMVPVLCPQDCTRSVVGAFLNPSSKRGISQGMGLCWCDRYFDCYCSNHLLGSEEVEANTDIRDNKDPNTKETQHTIHYHHPTKSPIHPGEIPAVLDPKAVCDYKCKLAGISAIAGLILMCFFTLLLCNFYKRRKRSIKLKHIGGIGGSVVSLNNVTSVGNHDENENETVGENHHGNEVGGDMRYALTGGVNLKIKPDPKWEVPRANLVLDKTLGEGEFGKVVRAQAIDLAGKKGATMVAVKMLKDCATTCELRDLLSEYNLLKDVNHKNVIRLLGACTLSDQIMVIVEFCAKGSLKSYLQSCRCNGEVTETGCIIYKIQNDSGALEDVDETYTTPISSRHHVDNIGYMLGSSIQLGDTTQNLPQHPSLQRRHLLQNHHDTPGSVVDSSESSTGTEDMIEILTVKDLMSLAWQIANGMQYLCDMKVLHRDLAARNVLVTQDKVAKISDFGLSRDIYTEDHYMKRSKGRVPVKWMAPESLYHSVYTTKSDVWSYGVVLWEITTMGATPYPGVAPESLLNLLKNGYRMTKPQGCSDHVYEVMKKCWHPDSACRPSFKELSNIFEKILKDSAGYLDLSSVYDEHLPLREHSTAENTADEAEPDYGSINVLSMDHNTYVTSPRSTSQKPLPPHNAFPPNIVHMNPTQQRLPSNQKYHLGNHHSNKDTNREVVVDHMDPAMDHYQVPHGRSFHTTNSATTAEHHQPLHHANIRNSLESSASGNVSTEDNESGEDCASEQSPMHESGTTTQRLLGYGEERGLLRNSSGKMRVQPQQQGGDYGSDCRINIICNNDVAPEKKALIYADLDLNHEPVDLYETEI